MGQLIERKGIRELVQAFEAAGRGRLTIVGDGPLKPAVKEAGERHPAIEYLGHLPPEQLDDVYADHDVLVLPAAYEVWGLVVNEALASGLQVIVSDAVGSSHDLVRHGVNGLIVPARRAGALEEAIRTAADWSPPDFVAADVFSQPLMAEWSLDRAAEEIVRACTLAASAERDGPS